MCEIPRLCSQARVARDDIGVFLAEASFCVYPTHDGAFLGPSRRPASSNGGGRHLCNDQGRVAINDDWGERVIYELRTYTLKPGTVPAYLKLNAEVGRPVRGDRYGKLIGAWTTEFGTLNQYVHLWEYADANERDRLRADLAQNPDWAPGYTSQIRPFMLKQENTFLSLDEDIGLRSVEGSGHIYELRTYSALPGAIGGWAAGFKRSLAQRETHSKLVGLWTTEVGGLNAAKHLWVYDSLQHRTAVREAMAADKELLAQRATGGPSPLIGQESVILIPTKVSPLQ